MLFETCPAKCCWVLLLAAGLAAGCEENRVPEAPAPEAAATKIKIPDDGSRFRVVRQGKIGFIDSSGTVRIAPIYANAGGFAEELAAVQLEAGGRWGYIDREGRVVIQVQFDGAEPFSQGLAAVQIGDRHGYIDKAGATVIPPTYKSAESFDRDGCAWVTTPGPQYSDDNHWIDRNGARIEAEIGGRCGPASRLGFQWDKVIGPVAVQYDSTPVKVQRKAVRDRASGRLIGPYDVFEFQGIDDDVFGSKRDFAFAVCSSAVYEWITYYSLRLVSARCGLFDESAREVLPLNFDGVRYLGHGRAAVAFGNPTLETVEPRRLEAPKTRLRVGRSGKLERYADERRDVVTSVDTRVIGIAGDKRRWGLVEIPGGRPLGNPVFEWIDEFKDGLAVAKFGGKKGYIGLDGKWALEPVFTSAYPFQGALAEVEKDDRSIYIDRSGKEVAIADDGTKVRAGPPDDLPDTKAPTTATPSTVRLGTAFFVSDHEVVTNAHVVTGCSRVENTLSGETAEKVLMDKQLDLALVRFNGRAPAYLRIRRAAPELGEQVAAFGYPLDGVLSSSGVATFGNVSALSGIGDRTDLFQMSAQIGPGSSGGPVLDGKGSVIGVVVARLDDRKLVAATGAVPQNANFAVKGVALLTFLTAHGVTPTNPQFWHMAKSQEELSQLAKVSTTRLRCIK